ncbi:MAG TPA: chromate transporter, partial [Clostridiales bacterium]|nr:chromate transporter [Clostridiales bacterium]
YTKAQMTNMIAIAEATPGPVGVNMATYAGYNAAGVLGGIAATIALILPGIVIIFCVAKFLSAFSDHPLVKAVFYGIRPAVTA